ncbi:unnamed protein product [Arabidopsis arenosa]|uniref:MADS-box domain-containing protein n=1 Tax=Arabidopsis arenosa TaxID=38785 RepID=A0A8S2AWK5_ARAAE|nr:unnamed protein product [Arabidopsis arenosa]
MAMRSLPSSSSSSSYSLASTSLSNRLETIFKKASELCTLCDIKACVIYYGPDGELKTWPKEREKVRDIALRLRFVESQKHKETKPDHQSLASSSLNQQTQSLNPSQFSLFMYNHGDNTLSQIPVSASNFNQDFSALLQQSEFKNQLVKQELCGYDQNMCMSNITNNSFQHPCVSNKEHYSAVQESVNNYELNQLMQKELYGCDQKLSNINSNNFQHPCVSNTQHNSAVQESLDNYGLNQLMQHELYGFDQNLCTSDITNSNVPNPSLSYELGSDFHDSCGNMVGNTSFSQDISTDTNHTISELNKSASLNIRRFSYKENSRPVTFHSFPYIPALEELKLVNLNIQKLSDGIGHLEFLEKLDLSGNDFENLPEVMNRLARLKTLCLRNCSKLKELPELTQVQSLTLSNCRSLRSLVKLSDASQDPGIYCLLELCLDNCKNVKSLSDQLSHFTKLTYLDLSSHDFKTLSSSIRDLTSLVTLCLNNCKKLKSLEELPLSLQFLDAQGCDSLEADALEHFIERLNKEVPAQPCSARFQETEMPSYERDHQATKSRLPKFLCCSHF